MFASYFSFKNSAITDIPLVGMVVDEADEVEDAADKAADALDSFIDKADDLSNDAEDAAEELQVAFEDLSDTVSINNIINAYDAFGALQDEVDESEALDIDMDFAEDMSDILSIVSTVVLFLFILLCLPFTLCGGIFRKNGLVVVGLIFTAIFNAILCGFLFVIISIALHIAIFVFNKKVNSAYKNYTSTVA